MIKRPPFAKYGFNSNFSFIAYLLLTLIIYPLIVFSLPQFKDFHNYISHVERSDILLANFAVLVAKGSASAILAEPLWPGILQVFKLFFTPEVVLSIITALSLFMLSLGVSKINKKPWLTLFLVIIIYPLATKYLFQIRQGFAIGIYMWAYSMEGKKAVVLRLLTPMIHMGLFLLIPIEAAYIILKKLRLSKRLLIIFSSTFAVVIVVVIPILISVMGSTFISQDFNLRAPTVSGLGVMLWAGYGLVFFLISKPSKEVALGITGILIFVFSQFYIDIGSRLIPMFLPFIIASQFYKPKKKLILICLTIVFGLILWTPTVLNPGRIFVN